MQRPTILLATFNGERFLRQLVDSIDGQTFAEWQVLARDDGSEDETGDLLERWAKRDSRVTVIRDGKRQSPSAASNFAALLDEAVNSDGDLFFFCDQDDIWEPEKIEVCLSAIENHNASAPLLLVSNLKLIDAQDSRDLGTFWDSNMMPPLEKRTTAELCSRNLYPGCSMAFNRSLLELAAGVPSGVIMHDWWLAILAQASSRIIEVPRPLVRYRQHSNNT
ncbi:MAG: glycosyltransferase family 2 protein, partial [Pseudomonadota bacterium]